MVNLVAQLIQAETIVIPSFFDFLIIRLSSVSSLKDIVLTVGAHSVVSVEMTFLTGNNLISFISRLESIFCVSASHVKSDTAAARNHLKPWKKLDFYNKKGLILGHFLGVILFIFFSRTVTDSPDLILAM